MAINDDDRTKNMALFGGEIFATAATLAQGTDWILPRDMPNIMMCAIIASLVYLRQVYPEVADTVARGTVKGLLHSLVLNGFPVDVTVPPINENEHSGVYRSGHETEH